MYGGSQIVIDSNVVATNHVMIFEGFQVVRTEKLLCLPALWFRFPACFVFCATVVCSCVHPSETIQHLKSWALNFQQCLSRWYQWWSLEKAWGAWVLLDMTSFPRWKPGWSRALGMTRRGQLSATAQLLAINRAQESVSRCTCCCFFLPVSMRVNQVCCAKCIWWSGRLEAELGETFLQLPCEAVCWRNSCSLLMEMGHAHPELEMTFIRSGLIFPCFPPARCFTEKAVVLFAINGHFYSTQT